MNLINYIIKAFFTWLPDWQACVFIAILAILILTGRSRAALVFLFFSAYIWGIVYFKANPVLSGAGNALFRAVFYTGGIIVLVGVVIVFWIKQML